jgi:hypothetical protein
MTRRRSLFRRGSAGRGGSCGGEEASQEGVVVERLANSVVYSRSSMRGGPQMIRRRSLLSERICGREREEGVMRQWSEPNVGVRGWRAERQRLWLTRDPR